MISVGLEDEVVKLCSDLSLANRCHLGKDCWNIALSSEVMVTSYINGTALTLPLQSGILNKIGDSSPLLPQFDLR